jgi:type III pantothenate kinase
MILGFDVGNSSTVMGAYDADGVEPLICRRYPTKKDLTFRELDLTVGGFLDELSEKGGGMRIEGAVLSSVVPETDNQYRLLFKKKYGMVILEVGSGIKLNIGLNYDNPGMLGADRIANAVAAFSEHRRDAIVADLGTATTFSVIRGNGEFDGGLIAPGIGIAIEALKKSTSKLPLIELRRPEKIVSRNTVDAITSGFYYGWVSLIEGIIRRIEGEYGMEFMKILTGGWAEKIGMDFDMKVIVDKNLTMKGIKYIYDMNV